MYEHSTAILMSRYRQLRLTATQQSRGRIDYSLYAKGLNMAWSERQLLLRDSVAWTEPLVSTEDVVAACVAILREQMLPGVG